MRDPELLLSLLRKMAADDYGRLNFVKTLGMNTEQQIEAHHLELLADSGLVEWWERQFPRITNSGYDFIEAVDKNGRIKEVFINKLKEGVPLLQAIAAALNMVS